MSKNIWQKIIFIIFRVSFEFLPVKPYVCNTREIRLPRFARNDEEALAMTEWALIMTGKAFATPEKNVRTVLFSLTIPSILIYDINQTGDTLFLCP